VSPASTYLCLAGSIITEVIATIALASSQSFSKPLASVVSVLCFAAAFWLLSFPLRTMPTGVVYAVWSGLSIVLVTAVAWVWSKQALDLPALLGMALIAGGVVVINAFSNANVVGALQSPIDPVSAIEQPERGAQPTRRVIQEGKFEWGWFKAYSDSSIELEAHGERRRYRNFAELERERSKQRSR
jgi:small multidrug resistance pump